MAVLPRARSGALSGIVRRKAPDDFHECDAEFHRSDISAAAAHLPHRDRIHPMKFSLASWQFWALMSACFAALTAIFAKVGVENVGSDFATFIRTVVILVALAAILTATGGWQG